MINLLNKKIYIIFNTVALISFLLMTFFPVVTSAQTQIDDVNFDTGFNLSDNNLRETSNVEVDDFGFNVTGLDLQQYQDAYDSARESIDSENPNELAPPDDAFLSMDGVAEACVTSLLSSVLTQNLNTLLGKIFPNFFEVPIENKAEALKNTGFKIAGFTVFPPLDGLGYCLANSIIESMLRSTINWVKGDFSGKPAFIDDPGQFFLDYADYQVGGALDAITGGEGDICSPWAINVKLALILSYTGESYRPNCSLSDIVNNIEGFVDGNFEEGGWDGWFRLTQSPSNNPLGSFLLYRDKIYADLSRNNGTLSAEIGWNQGFLSVKDPELGKTTTPGVLLARAVSDTLNVPRERLTIADEFDELITELVNAMVRFSVGEMLTPFSS